MISGNSYQISSLISLPESEFLDFKSEYHSNNAALVHDILCLLNSDTENDKFLIFGVDDSGTVVGCATDSNRKNQAEITNLLTNSNFNILPTIKLETHRLGSNEVDVLILFNRPEKPYFLLKTKEVQGKKVRAGVTFTRSGDTNTPIDSCVDDKKLEMMFKERFRLDASPSERLNHLLLETEEWKYYYRDDNTYFYHRMFPEFKIEMREAGEREFRELWTQGYPDPSTYRYDLTALYFNTVIFEDLAVSLDGGRVLIVIPNKRVKWHTSGMDRGRFYYFYTTDSTRYLLNEMIRAVYPQASRTWRDGPFNIFESEQEADSKIDAHFSQGTETLIYYDASSESDTATRQEG